MSDLEYRREVRQVTLTIKRDDKNDRAWERTKLAADRIR